MSLNVNPTKALELNQNPHQNVPPNMTWIACLGQYVDKNFWASYGPKMMEQEVQRQKNEQKALEYNRRSAPSASGQPQPTPNHRGNPQNMSMYPGTPARGNSGPRPPFPGTQFGLRPNNAYGFPFNPYAAQGFGQYGPTPSQMQALFASRQITAPNPNSGGSNPFGSSSTAKSCGPFVRVSGAPPSFASHPFMNNNQNPQASSTSATNASSAGLLKPKQEIPSQTQGENRRTRGPIECVNLSDEEVDTQTPQNSTSAGEGNQSTHPGVPENQKKTSASAVERNITATPLFDSDSRAGETNTETRLPNPFESDKSSDQEQPRNNIDFNPSIKLEKLDELEKCYSNNNSVILNENTSPDDRQEEISNSSKTDDELNSVISNKETDKIQKQAPTRPVKLLEEIKLIPKFPAKCRLCKKSLKRPSIQQHIRVEYYKRHDIQPLECSVCPDSKFSTLPAVSQHIKRRHKGKAKMIDNRWKLEDELTLFVKECFALKQSKPKETSESAHNLSETLERIAKRSDDQESHTRTPSSKKQTQVASCLTNSRTPIQSIRTADQNLSINQSADNNIDIERNVEQPQNISETETVPQVVDETPPNSLCQESSDFSSANLEIQTPRQTAFDLLRLNLKQINSFSSRTQHSQNITGKDRKSGTTSSNPEQNNLRSRLQKRKTKENVYQENSDDDIPVSDHSLDFEPSPKKSRSNRNKSISSAKRNQSIDDQDEIPILHRTEEPMQTIVLSQIYITDTTNIQTEMSDPISSTPISDRDQGYLNHSGEMPLPVQTVKEEPNQTLLNVTPIPFRKDWPAPPLSNKEDDSTWSRIRRRSQTKRTDPKIARSDPLNVTPQISSLRITGPAEDTENHPSSDRRTSENESSGLFSTATDLKQNVPNENIFETETMTGRTGEAGELNLSHDVNPEDAVDEPDAQSEVGTTVTDKDKEAEELVPSLEQWRVVVERAMELSLTDTEYSSDINLLLTDLREHPILFLQLKDDVTAVNYIFQHHQLFRNVHFAIAAVALLKEGRIPKELDLIDWRQLTKRLLKSQTNKKMKLKKLIKDILMDAKRKFDVVFDKIFVSESLLRDFLLKKVNTFGKKMAVEGKYISLKA